jgi:hypothetical protein
MAVIASGISKLLTFAKQTALGVPAGVGTGQSLRRTMSTMDKSKATYASKEIRPSQQRADFRHGVVAVGGTISGELSVGTYQKFLESICRQTSITLGTKAYTDLVLAQGSPTSIGTIATTAGNFVTDGFRVGMVIRATALATTTTMNNVNLLITNINATGKTLNVATLNGSVIAPGISQAGSLTPPGKYTYVPQTGQTRDYYSIEHNFADIAQSELFQDCVVTQANIKLPASGMAGIDFVMKGLDMRTNTQAINPITQPYFTSPSAVTSGVVLAAANGVLFLNNVAVALITGMNFSIKGNHSMIGGVVGSNIEPDVFPGDVVCDGQVTVLFQDGNVRDLFLNESEVALVGVFTADSTNNAAFTSFTFPRVKVGGANKDDGEKGLVMTMPFTALEYVKGDNLSFPTTLVIQDSAYV